MGRKDYESSPSSIEVKNEWIYTSISPNDLIRRKGQVYSTFTYWDFL